MSDLMKSQFFACDAWINGQWVKTEKCYDVFNPANSMCIAQVARCGLDEANAAIDAAQTRFTSFKKTLAKERSVILREIANLLLQHRQELAALITTEQGKPLAEALGEINYAASYFEWFGEEAKRIDGDIIPSHKVDARIFITREPVGVVAAITPWNFPLAMFARKMAAAIAAGCTVVWKPSEETPLTALALARISEMAGLPAGVLNIVSGDAVAIGEAFMRSTDVKKITFTGSTRTGQLLLEQAAKTIKRVSMELGGNAPFIVFEDADVDAAVHGAMVSKFRNTGQTCVCVNRFYIHSSIYDQFVTKLSEAVSKLRVADGFTDGVEQGPLINQAAVGKVSAHIADALAKGGRLMCGGKPHELGHTFFEPTVIAKANNHMLVTKEETFGPLAACFCFDTEEEVIALANDTDYGLSAYFYTQNLARAFRVAEALEVGMVGVNDGIISTEIAPFGGIKHSGMGREGSKYGVDDYLSFKYTLFGGIAPSQ